jgi:hypothetical protein
MSEFNQIFLANTIATDSSVSAVPQSGIKLNRLKEIDNKKIEKDWEKQLPQIPALAQSRKAG